ncbi:GATA transcription factor 12-like [Chlorella sorokiniana]|uniref:GATA transcription factor 12-like n=1 Tax=Chlorella sorokiniana TaxID=3076 RepID=A0A2P6U169_CHLSO|nr:GATA transcription factor 12-like [Chlorella sorokiniana]|eukprot:PRW60051.1 GATA transcription factor 12-like [Chlorella sorokiniana]
MDSAAGGGGVAGLLPPLRQISLDVIQATVLGREKGLHRQPSERQNIFQDVFNELAGKDETAPLQSGQLYTLPSMQFLESMLSDFDRQANGGAMGGPLDIPVDAFDLPESFGQSAGLRPTPFDQQQQQQQQAQQQQQQQQALLMHQRAAMGYGGAPHRDSTGTASTGFSSFVPMGSAASAPVALGPLHNSGSLPLGAQRAHSGYAPGQMAPVVVAPSAAMDAHAQHYHLMALQQQQAAYQQQVAVQRHQQQRAAAAAALRGPAPPQPVQPRATPTRRQSHAYADFEYEEAEVTVQTSKSGRVRKVASFTGVKRRLDVAHTASESRDSRGSVGNGVDSGEVGSKGSKGGRKGPTGPRGKKGRRTVCLNCGCHQTPQWRCGPLGPRTLCNACGVRYKKDLPLNCWPIRDGMVLPPGAMLPPGFVVPPGITIHTQPGDFE